MIDLAIDGRVFIDNDLDAALQELDMLFNTTNCELIGYPKYGSNFEYFLWQLNPSTSTLKQYIEELMSNSYFLAGMQKNIFVDILEGEYRKIYYIRIDLYYKDKTGYREYQIR